MARPKGSKTRAEMSRDLIVRIEKRFPGKCPVEELFQLALNELELIDDGEICSPGELMSAIEKLQDGDPRAYEKCVKKITNSKEFAADALNKVATYIYAKPKSIEIEDKTENTLRPAVVVPMVENKNWEADAQKAAEETIKFAMKAVGEDEDLSSDDDPPLPV